MKYVQSENHKTFWNYFKSWSYSQSIVFSFTETMLWWNIINKQTVKDYRLFLYENRNESWPCPVRCLNFTPHDYFSWFENENRKNIILRSILKMLWLKSCNKNNPYIKKWVSMYYIGTPTFWYTGYFCYLALWFLMEFLAFPSRKWSQIIL